MDQFGALLAEPRTNQIARARTISSVKELKIIIMPMFYQAVQTSHALKTIPLSSFLKL